jgi:GNAT superfamily N-acetyltransferase
MTSPLHWRPMRPDDIPAVYALSRRVHTDHPEREAVLAEKLTLFPAGCFVLEADGDGVRDQLIGYAFSHPWARDSVPSLDTFLTALPDHPSTYFIHDVTLDDSARGHGHAAAIVPVLVDVARTQGLTHMMLVAVNGAEVFWGRFGFVEIGDAALRKAIHDRYGLRAVMMHNAS